MSKPALILDNSVLSAVYTADWLDDLSFYPPDQSIIVPHLVWNGEFAPHHSIKEVPSWLIVREANLNAVQTQAAGQLSKADWSCIAVAEQIDGEATVITNDRALRTVATRRDVDAEWGTHFVIRTFKACAITTPDFQETVSTYLTDVTLPPEVADEVQNTEK